MKFKNDAQRKAVMAQMNTNISNHSISNDVAKSPTVMNNKMLKKNSEFTPKSDLLKKYFPDGIPISPNVTRYNFEKQKFYPVPLIVETDYLDTLVNSFLTDDGYYINAGQVTDKGYRITHSTVLNYLTGSNLHDLNTDQIAQLADKLHLIRVADSYGDVIVHVPGKITPIQLRRLNQLVKECRDESKDLRFDVGSDDLSKRFSTDDVKEFYAELRKRGWIS